jgi:hypothetical protein
MANDPKSLSELLDRLEELAQEKEEMRAGELAQAFGSRSYGPFLIVPALIELSPIGSVPGVPTALAVIVLLFAGQMLFGRKHLWLPQFVTKRRMDAGRVGRAIEKLRPLGQRVDKWFHDRLPALTRGPFIRIAAAACIVLAFCVPPLEFVPFASSAPMGAIALFGLALLVRDGVLMIAASLLACVALFFGLRLLI